MSFKEFLEDLEASQASQIAKFQSEYLESEPQTRAALRYPPLESLPQSPRPTALSGDCNIWGSIPFHEAVLSRLVSAGTPSKFDWIHGRLGMTARRMNEVQDFIDDTHRLSFFLVDPAPSYAKMDYLEPIIRALKPPHLITYFPEDEIERWRFVALERSFDDIAGDGILEYLVGFEQARESGNPEALAIRGYTSLRQTYAILNLLGFGEFALKVEEHLRIDPYRAVHLLELFKNVLVGPALDRTGMTRLITWEDSSGFAQVGGESTEIGQAEAAPYEIGRFLLKAIVLFPETIDGCREVTQFYEDAELARARDGLSRAVSRDDKDGIAGSVDVLVASCQEVWERANQVRRLESVATFAPSVLIGAVGAAASGLPGIGVLASLGFLVADRFLGQNFGAPLSSRLTRQIIDPHLFAVYDFQKTLSRRHRPVSP